MKKKEKKENKQIVEVHIYIHQLPSYPQPTLQPLPTVTYPPYVTFTYGEAGNITGGSSYEVETTPTVTSAITRNHAKNNIR